MAYNRTLQHFTSPQELATLWATGQTYLLNQVVFQDNKLYRCLINHTSGTFQTDYANSNWVEISSGLVPWITAVYYTANQFVEQGNDIYRCLISHTSGTFATDLGAGKWIEVSAGSGSGLKNYVVNGDFEQNTDTGWSLASSTLDATTKLPNQVSASWTSASGSLSKSVISSGQLAGTYSLQLSSTAATTAGNMLVTNALTLDLEAQASVQTFSFFYKVTSNGTGTPDFSGTSSNAIGVAIYDVTNSAWIQPAGVFNLVQSSGVGKASGTFQCPSNCTSVRLAVYFPNSTAASGGSPFTVVFDDFVLGPQVVQYGAPVTDWQSFTPVWTAATANPTIGTTSVNQARWRRVGDSLEIQYSLVQTGAGTAGSGYYTLSIPNGLTIDSSKITFDSPAAANKGVVGFGLVTDNSAFSNDVSVLADSSTKLNFVINDRGSFVGAITSPNITFSNAGFKISFFARVPISGWSSSVQMSNDTDTRVVAARATITSGGPFTTSSIIIFNSKTDTTRGEIDTHSAYNTTTGVYTVPVSGIYQIDLSLWSGAGGTYLVRLEDGAGAVEYGRFFQNNVGIGGANISVSGSITKTFNAGDTFRIAQTFGTATWANDANNTRLSIRRLSGPATIAASETVAARYTSSAANPVTDAAFNFIDFATKDYDTHGMVTGTGSGNTLVTNTGWKATIPVSGKYLITASTLANIGGGWAAGEYWETYILKNGNGVTSGINVSQATHSTYMPSRVAAIVQCTAGDRIEIAIYQTSGATINQNNSGIYNEINIVRVGN